MCSFPSSCQAAVWFLSTATTGFCTGIPLSAKFLLSEFFWVKDYKNHWLESPPSRWYLSAPLLPGLWTEDGSPPMLHVRDPELFWQITSPRCTTGSRLKQFRRDGCDSLAEIVFAALDFCRVMAQEKKWFNCFNQSWGMIEALLINYLPYLPGCHLPLAPPQVRD